MTSKAAFALPKAVQKNIISYIDARYKDFPMHTMRERLEKIDKAVQLESELRNKNRVNGDYFNDTELPTIKTPVSKLSNFLIDIFVGARIFEAVSPDPANADAVKQLNAIVEENSKTSKWPKELIVFLRDIARYPYAAISCTWVQEQIVSIISDSTAEDANASGVALETIGRQGNKLKRYDPYNTFFDTSVSINDVHTDGEFSGHIERISQIELFKRLANFKIGGNPVMNEGDKLWGKSSTTPNRYYTPEIVPEHELEETSSSLTTFFGNGPDELKDLGKGARYEWVTFNARIIPKMFGMKVPAADKIQIWKFYAVNWDTLVYAEKQTNAHGYTDAVFVQITEDGLKAQTKSKAEELVPLQNLSTLLHDARLAGMKRSIGDRALYDSSRIDKKHINSERPDAKIPVKPSMLKGGLSDAYLAIPYNDNTASAYYQALQFLKMTADETVGFNRPQQGQFQKGNKTLGEFNEVMSNADDDLRTYAKLVEAIAMVPLKTMIKVNIFQFQMPENIVTPSTGEEVNINPSKLRRTAMQFKLADGLVDKDQLLDLPTLNSLLQLVLQIPMLQQRYDIIKLIEQGMNSVGFDTSKFSNGGQGGQQAAPPNPAAPPEGAQ